MKATAVAFAILLCAAAAPAAAQSENPIVAELRKEADRIKEDCGAGLKKIVGCAATLVTDHPVHLAFGSIAPQNGFGLGGAFSAISNRSINWPLSFSADAVAATGGAWRTGAYLRFRHTSDALPTMGAPGTGSAGGRGIQPFPIFSIHAQGISLPALSYYGLGPNTLKADRTAFSMRQIIVGGSAIVPVRTGALSRLSLAFLAGANARWMRIGAATSDKAPSIETRFTAVTAPGMTDRRGFVEVLEGVRLKPTFANGRLALNYLGQFQQFVSSSSAKSSFGRWTVDLAHEVSIFTRSGSPVPPDGFFGPNECQTDSNGRCPKLVPERIKGVPNRTGTVGVRLMMSKSQAFGASTIPFYFQQTLGGSDINGSRLLASYDDYRFRGPNVLVLQETFEHVIAGSPVGVWLAADQGTVALGGQGLNVGRLRHTYAVGATIRAGAVPMMTASWATGGPEGHHIAFTISTSLLGSSSRPSLH